jgi:hypothetical protein
MKNEIFFTHENEIFFIGRSDLPVSCDPRAQSPRERGKTASFATRHTGQVAPAPILD